MKKWGLFGWYRARSLSQRLLISQFTILTSALILCGLVFINLSRDMVREDSNQRNDHLAIILANHIEDEFSNLWDNARLFTYQVYTTPDTLLLQAQAMLDFRRTSPLTYRALYLFDSQGHQLIHLDDPIEQLLKITSAGEVLARPPLAALPLEIEKAVSVALRGNYYISPVSILGPDRLPVVYLGLRLAPDAVFISQVMVIELDLRSLWRRIDEISIKGGYAYIVSGDGTIIAHPQRDRIGQKLDPDLARVLAGYQGHVEYISPHSGRALLASFSPVGKTSGWGVVIEQDRTVVFETFQFLLWTVFGLLFAAIALSVLATGWISRGIVRPLRELARVTQAIADTQKLDQDILVEGQDEVAQLAHAFNEMIASLRQAQSALHEHSDMLETAVERRTHDLVFAQEQLAKHAAELEFAIKELESFSYSVSHDLRAPLRAIDGYATILLNDYGASLAPEAQNLLENMRRNAQRMGTLINDLLDFARMGRMALTMGPVDLKKLVQEVVASLQPEIGSRQVEVTVGDLPVWPGDEAMLYQVFIHLISNAFKFTRSRPVARIEIGCQYQANELVCFVTDNGVGFDMRYAEKLFRLFQRLHGFQEYEGTGIGLASVQRLVQKHGGGVWVESALDQGSTFYFTLPASRF